MRPRPIYIAIMAAAEEGRGLHLSADEVAELSQDDAISHRAMACLPDDDEAVTAAAWSWNHALRAHPNPIPGTEES